MKYPINFIENSFLTSGGCWYWKGHLHRQGYGYPSINGRMTLAHRAAFMQYRGKIPAGIKVCHKCDNPQCVNPWHLFLGTQKQNVEDAMRKGHMSRALTLEHVIKIKRLLVEGRLSQYAIAKKFQVKQPAISNIRLGKTYSHLPCPALEEIIRAETAAKAGAA